MTSVDLLGTRIDAGELAEVADELEGWIAERRRGVVCRANVHVLETARRNSALAAALGSSELVLADGAPVAWAAGLLSGRPAPRIAGSDLFDELCRRSPAAGYRHCFVGSTPRTLGRLMRAVRRRYPGIAVCGAFSPSFRPPKPREEELLAAMIDAARPDIVWVGLGAPKQELWMARMRPRLEAPVLAGVGAVFDFASGTKPRAPRALQRLGLEWAHRLAHEPRRLGGRYVATNTTFILACARLLATKSRGG